MTETILGKITFAEFGTIKDYPFMIGLQVGFHLANGGGIMCGGKYTINISEDCKWSSEERKDTITVTIEYLYDLLKNAKVNYVSELIDKPVEVTIENNTFKSFRILTEVL